MKRLTALLALLILIPTIAQAEVMPHIEADCCYRLEDRCEQYAINVNCEPSVPTYLPLEVVEAILPDTLKDYAQAFVDGEREYCVNMLFVMAIAKEETNSGLAGTGASKNNLFGVKGGSSYKTFEDFGDSIDNQFRLLGEKYIANGRTSIDSIASIYCVPADGWISKVSNSTETYSDKAAEVLDENIQD